MIDTTDPDLDLLRPGEVARLLGVDPMTLLRWRAKGEGPVWFRLGPGTIRYRRRELVAWAEARAGMERQ